MKHCDKGAKPLQGFGGAAPSAGVWGRSRQGAGGLGVQLPKVQRVRGAQHTGCAGSEGQRCLVIFGEPEAAPPGYLKLFPQP